MDEFVSKKLLVAKFNELASKYTDGDKRQRRLAYATAADIIAFTDAADVQPVDRWISVNDRLPENCIEVLVHDTDCGIVIGWYDKEIGDFAADFISPLDAVTHWQPLPEQPKDGDTNE